MCNATISLTLVPKPELDVKPARMTAHVPNEDLRVLMTFLLPTHAGHALQKFHSHLTPHAFLLLMHHDWHLPVVVAGAMESPREELAVVIVVGADNNRHR